MHALIHRALTPQTITYAWLVLTVALTLALAVAQSAIASGAALSQPAGIPAAHAVLGVQTAPGAAHDAGARACRTAAPADDARAAATGAPGGRACRAPVLRDLVPAFRLPAGPAPRPGADALVALFGGAGPHGPPARPGTKKRPLPARYPGAHLDLDSTLSLPVAPPSAAAVELLPPLMRATDLTA